MPTDIAIREAIERIVQDLRRDPASALGTTQATARIEDGLTCVVTEGSWTLRSDVPPSVGGGGMGPSPGVYGRAAVASCVAIGIKMIAARRNHPVRSVSVDVQGDYDWRGDFDLDDVPPGFLQFRLMITVDSPAEAAATERVVADALRLSSWLNTLAREQPVAAELEIAGDQSRRAVALKFN